MYHGHAMIRHRRSFLQWLTRRPPQLPGEFTGHGELTVTVARGLPTTLAGRGALTATVTPKLSAALAGRGALTASAHATRFTFTAALHGHGGLTPTGPPPWWASPFISHKPARPRGNTWALSRRS